MRLRPRSTGAPRTARASVKSKVNQNPNQQLIKTLGASGIEADVVGGWKTAEAKHATDASALEVESESDPEEDEESEQYFDANETWFFNDFRKG